MLNDPTGADFTIIVPDGSRPGYWQVITMKVDEPASSSNMGNYPWSGQDWVMKTAFMTQDEIYEYQKGQAEAAAAAAMAPSDPMMARSYYASLQSQGPKVYNKWCNCEVNAFDVVAHDPTYQNKEYRRQAQDAIYNYMKQQAGTGPGRGSNFAGSGLMMQDGLGNEDRNPSQDKKLTPGEIEKLKEHGWDHSDKGVRGGRRDLYKDRDGNIYEKPKGGVGEGEPIGINIKDLNVVGKGVVIGVAAVAVYEVVKWGVAIVLAPETLGGSLAAAAAVP